MRGMQGGSLMKRMIVAEICEAGGRQVLKSKLLSALSGTGAEAGGVRIGEVFGRKGCFAFEEVRSYTRLTGDPNPIHISASAAREAGFDACVVPGMLVASLFPAIIGSRFAGAVYVSQDLKFKAPLLVGEPFLAEVEVCTIVKLREHAKVMFSTRCLQDREEKKRMLLDGQAVALLPMSFIVD